MKYNQEERVIYCREASKVKRCHNFPWIGEYTVGQHTFDMLTLCLQLHPNPSPRLIKAIVAHDLGERMVGDMPAPFKWAMPDVADDLQSLEDSILENVKMSFIIPPEDVVWLHALDRIELWLAAHDQVMLGNQYAKTMITALEGWFARERDELPRELVQFIQDYKPKRLQDELP